MPLFLGDKMISDLPPVSYATSDLRFTDVFYSTVEFMDEHFKGAVEVTGNVNAPGTVTVSPEGLVHFIKRLLTIVYGESVLKIHMDIARFSFKIILEWKRKIPLSESEKQEFEIIANQSDFQALFEETDDGGKFILNLKVLHSPILYLYEKSPRFLLMYLNQGFFFIVI